MQYTFDVSKLFNVRQWIYVLTLSITCFRMYFMFFAFYIWKIWISSYSSWFLSYSLNGVSYNNRLSLLFVFLKKPWKLFCSNIYITLSAYWSLSTRINTRYIERWFIYFLSTSCLAKTCHEFLVILSPDKIIDILFWNKAISHI